MTKDIPNYEGLYKITCEGEVLSTPSGGKRRRTLKQEEIVRKHTTYKRVSLSKDGKVTRFQVHRLVAEAFLPLVEGKSSVNHKDNNGRNNEVSNLEWCTQKENVAHSIKQGRFSSQQNSTVSSILKTRELDTTTRLKGLLQERFISLEFSRRSKATVLCLCGDTFTRRVDEVTSTSICTKCSKQKKSEKMTGHTNSPTKAVTRLTLSGEIVAQYDSIKVAKLETGDCNINNVLNGKYKQSKGYKWQYTENLIQEAHHGS